MEKRIENDRAYRQNLGKIKSPPLRRFLKHYAERGELHDWVIEKTELYSMKNSLQCKMTLSSGRETVCLRISDISSYAVDAQNLSACINGEVGWGYCEVAESDNNDISVSVICDIFIEMHFEARKIALDRACGKRCKLSV